MGWWLEGKVRSREDFFKTKTNKITVNNDPEKQKRVRNAGRMSLRRRERVSSNGQLVGMAFSRGKDS